jgi:hypothetical protein
VNTEVVVALCSVVVVMIALAVGVWQAAVTRAHNRKSVQPVLQLSSSFREGDRVGLRLANVRRAAVESSRSRRVLPSRSRPRQGPLT